MNNGCFNYKYATPAEREEFRHPPASELRGYAKSLLNNDFSWWASRVSPERLKQYKRENRAKAKRYLKMAEMLDAGATPKEVEAYSARAQQIPSSAAADNAEHMKYVRAYAEMME